MRVINLSARYLLVAFAILSVTVSFTSCKTDEEPDWGMMDADNDHSGKDESDSDIPPAPTTIFYESFDGLTGQGGNDGYYDNDATAGVEIALDDLTTSDDLDNKTGWGEFLKVGICNKCVRLATKKSNGSITTPAITLDGQKATLTFHAAAQLDDDVTLYVAVSDGGQLIYEGNASSVVSIHLPATEVGKTVLDNQVYGMEIEGVGGSCQLTFYTESSSASKQRAFLDEIKVERK